eukprot:1252621-Pyramimonas_sp.AAC.1
MWGDFLGQAGHCGGQSATMVDVSRLPEARHDVGTGYRFYSPGFKDEAETDLRGIRRAPITMQYRKSTPPWSLPLEV